MISEGQFATEFEHLENAFSKVLNHKQKRWWFRSLEDRCDYEPFKITVERLVYSLSFFPKPKEFRIEYDMVLRDRFSGGKEFEPCGRCFDGVIRYQPINDHSYVAFCLMCYPGRRGAVDPRYVKVSEWESDPAEYNKYSEPLSKEETLALIRDIAEVIDRIGKRFGKKETKGPHKQMEEQHRQANIKRAQNEMDYEDVI